MADYDYSFKVAIIGDAEVGKTSVLAALVDDTPVNTKVKYAPTIGAGFKPKIVTIANKQVELNIWDTAGQERFSSLMPMYYRGAAIVVLVFDITRPETFERAKALLAEINTSEPNAHIILVGTKIDLKDERKVHTEEAQAFAHTHELTYLEGSATQADVKDLESNLSAAIHAKLKRLMAAGKVTTKQPASPQIHEPTIQVVSETPAGSSGTLFSGLFSRRTPAPNPYVLTRKANEDEISSSNDFKAIFNHLLGTAWLPNRKTEAAQAVLGAETLNIETLRHHAEADTSSRTTQAIGILSKLRDMLYNPVPGYSGTSLPFANGRDFLTAFTNRYLERYAADERRLGIFVQSPEMHGQVTRGEFHFDYSDCLVLAQNKIKIIKILCQAAEKPNSRTAIVVRALLEAQGPSSSHTSGASSSHTPGQSSGH